MDRTPLGARRTFQFAPDRRLEGADGSKELRDNLPGIAKNRLSSRLSELTLLLRQDHEAHTREGVLALRSDLAQACAFVAAFHA